MPESWQPTDGAAYRAVELVLEGNCAKQIAQILYGHHTPKEHGRVTSLLKHAKRQKLLKLRPPIKIDLQLQLAARFPGPVSFHVVNNDYVAYIENPVADEIFRGEAICRKAAEIVAQRIVALLQDKKRDPAKPLIIANAGGLAVSRVVRFLAEQKNLPVIADPRRLLFLSLNSAAMPTDNGRSANTLAVRLSEIFGGQHLALCPIWPADVKKAYDHAVRHIDLLICGAGTEHGLLFTWLRQNAGIKLPAAAVGDICLLPISATGDEVSLEKQAPRRVRETLNPHPTYLDLQALASRDSIIYVAMGYQSDDRRPDPALADRPKHSKLAVTQAILRHTLARTCILGTTLARDLLEATAPPQP